MTNSNHFIPRDKPKSWVVGSLSVISALLVAGPVTLIGIYAESDILFHLGGILFFGSWLLVIVMLVIYRVGVTKGKYVNLGKKDWSNQIW